MSVENDMVGYIQDVGGSIGFEEAQEFLSDHDVNPDDQLEFLVKMVDNGLIIEESGEEGIEYRLP